MTTTSCTQSTFDALGLADPILKAIQAVGYDRPSPIQALTIPHLLAGRDLIGQAQTGTGKTAAFALPLLSGIDLDRCQPQVLVLTPTRELAIQVAEAFQKYAAGLNGFHVLPVYGGQGYDNQLRRLKRGVHVIVGTPGRVMDHLRRGTLNLQGLTCLVLDEADEMLRMGFIDDVEWILEQTPAQRQVALFSATMPAAVSRIAKKHLKNPEKVFLQAKTSIVETIHQCFLVVHPWQKLNVLTRLLEAIELDGLLIFVRTKASAVELTSKLEARGYTSSPLTGDIPQAQRERTVEQLKSGKIDIVVATDVAARGLDVDRIGHVINFDVPGDIEAYVHRVGRTGRAGRSGEAILLLTPREVGWLKSIERVTGQRLEEMAMPSTQDINDQRLVRFQQRITDTLRDEDLTLARGVLADYTEAHDTDPMAVAAALARMVLGSNPLIDQIALPTPGGHRGGGGTHRKQSFGAVRPERVQGGFKGGSSRLERPSARGSVRPFEQLVSYRLTVGRDHGVRAADIVGAIANEVGLHGAQIGQIVIEQTHSTVDLPRDMPHQVLDRLKRVRISNQPSGIQLASEGAGGQPTGAKFKPTLEGKAKPAARFKPKVKPKLKTKPKFASASKGNPGTKPKRKAKKKK